MNMKYIQMFELLNSYRILQDIPQSVKYYLNMLHGINQIHVCEMTYEKVCLKTQDFAILTFIKI